MPVGYHAETLDVSQYETKPYVLEHWQNAVQAIDLGYPTFSCWHEIEQAVLASSLPNETEIMRISQTDDAIHDQWIILGIILTSARGIHSGHKNSIANTLEQLNPQVREKAIPALRIGFIIATENNIGESGAETKQVFNNYILETMDSLQGLTG